MLFHSTLAFFRPQFIGYFDPCLLEQNADGAVFQRHFMKPLNPVHGRVKFEQYVKGFFGYGASLFAFHRLNFNVAAFQWEPHLPSCKHSDGGVAASVTHDAQFKRSWSKTGKGVSRLINHGAVSSPVVEDDFVAFDYPSSGMKFTH